jgi:trypsin
MARVLAFVLWCVLIAGSVIACQSGCTHVQLPTVPAVTAIATATTTATPPDGGAGGVSSAPSEQCHYLPSRSSRRVLEAPRIVGGDIATDLLYPWMAALETFDGWQYCGGTVISSHWVLTAAHCQVQAGDVVHVGTTDLRQPGRRLLVVEVRNHPGWSSTTSGDDVAVVRIEDAAGVEPIELATVTPTAGTAWAIGWGATCEGCSGSAQLLHVELPIVSHSACVSAYWGDIDSTMICAGNAGHDACQGDSGGPLVVDGTQVGVTSWGEGCARPGAPGVWTDVAVEREWIEGCAQ